MTYRQDTVSSLILAPIRSGLRGFCLFILVIFSMEYQQKNPLRYYVLPFLFEFANNVCYGTKNKFFTTSALFDCIIWVDRGI